MTERRICGVLGLLLLAGCGGGGGGGGGNPPAVTVLATLKVVLRGDEVVPVVDDDARSAARLEVRSDGELRITLTGEVSWIPDVAEVRVRQGATGVTGASLVEFVASGGSFDGATLAFTGSASTSVANAEAVEADPASFHVVVVTSGAAAGLLRGQLAEAATDEVIACLAEDAPVPTVSGAIVASVSVSGVVSYVLALEGAAIASADAFQIVEDGIPLLPKLSLSTAVFDAVKQTATGGIVLPVALSLRLCARPEALAVRVLPLVGPPLAEGPLKTGPSDLLCRIRPGAGDLGGAGLTLRISSTSLATMTVALQATGPVLSDLTTLELRAGPIEAPGALVDDLLVPGLAKQPDDRSAQGSFVPGMEWTARLLALQAFHVRIESPGSAGPHGGSVIGTALPLFGDLGDTGTDHEGFPGRAVADLEVRSSVDLAFSIDAANPQVADATLVGAVIHATGTLPTTPLFDLLDAPPAQQLVDGNRRTGQLGVDPHRVARMIADPEAHELSLVTTGAPEGVARGCLIDGVKCAAGYIPPFEGNWGLGDDVESGSMSRQEYLACGAMSASFSFPGGVSGSGEGTYEPNPGDPTGSSNVEVDLATFEDAETAHYTGSVDDDAITLSTTDPVVDLPQQFTAEHQQFLEPDRDGVLWRASPGLNMVFGTDFDILTCNGVKIPFSGSDLANVVLDLTGIDLSPCPDLAAAWVGLTSVALSGGFTGVSAIHLVGTGFDHTFVRATKAGP